MSLMRTEGLRLTFGGVVAADDIDFALEEGERLAVIGANGAGKTTFINICTGFIRPDAGSVELDGQDVTGWRPERIAGIGMVRTFQVTQPFAGLTVAENIRVGAFLHTADPAGAMRTARELGSRLGLGAFLDRPASALTVAGRKRLEVARALATRPKVLLLDEVMAGLNPAEVADVVALVRSVRDGGVTILLIEHLMQAVAALAERAFVLAQGVLIAEGTPRQIATDPQVIEAYLGHGAAERLQASHADA